MTGSMEHHSPNRRVVAGVAFVGSETGAPHSADEAFQAPVSIL
jgi:hypothetical protein